MTTEIPHIRKFGAEASAAGIFAIEELGGKGINLCEMMRAGFAVPPGFVVTTRCYREFVEASFIGDQIRNLAAQAHVDDPAQLDELSAKIRALFAESTMSVRLAAEIVSAYGELKENFGGRVAVRSSATAEDLPTASFAGQQDTYLNISAAAAVLKAVQSCWASLWTSRAIVYRAQQHIPIEGLALAVVVQQMILADKAGVMFTANPVTGVRHETVINAAWGLGEAVVGGHVTPDNIVADKATGQTLHSKIAEKSVLTVMTDDGTEERELSDDRRHARVLDESEVSRLAEVGRRIEAHYGGPQDIEWAIADGQLFIVQARPITALAEDPTEGNRLRDEEILRLQQLASKKRHVWVTHNLRETLPFPTPLTWDIMRQFMSGNGGFGKMYRDFGYRPSHEVCEHGFLELICGRIYADPDRVAQLFWADLPMGYDLEVILKDMTALNRAPTKFEPEKANERFLLSLPGTIRAVLRSGRLMKRLRKDAKRRFEQDILPPFLEYIRANRGRDLSSLSVAELTAELRERWRIVLDEFGPESLKPSFFGAMAMEQLEALLVQILGDHDGRRVTVGLTMALEGDITFEQDELLYRVAKGEVPMADFLAKFGHRTTNEMELSELRWREDSSYLDLVVKQIQTTHGHVLGGLHARNVQKREEAQRELPAALAQAGGSSLREEIDDHLAEARALLVYRETGKYYLMMGYELLREAIVALGERLGLGSDIFFLQWHEIVDPEAHRDKIAQRKTRWKSAQRLELPDVIDSDHLAHLGEPAELANTDELTGDAVSSGVATGRAAIVLDPRSAGDLGTDYILVCPSTDPGWTPLFINASALIVERGGILSHGAIVARDFGIPAVVCPNATRLIANGATIRVDGNQGRVQIVRQP